MKTKGGGPAKAADTNDCVPALGPVQYDNVSNKNQNTEEATSLARKRGGCTVECPTFSCGDRLVTKLGYFKICRDNFCGLASCNAKVYTGATNVPAGARASRREAARIIIEDERRQILNGILGGAHCDATANLPAQAFACGTDLRLHLATRFCGTIMKQTISSMLNSEQVAAANGEARPIRVAYGTESAADPGFSMTCVKRALGHVAPVDAQGARVHRFLCSVCGLFIAQWHTRHKCIASQLNARARESLALVQYD